MRHGSEFKVEKKLKLTPLSEDSERDGGLHHIGMGCWCEFHFPGQADSPSASDTCATFVFTFHIDQQCLTFMEL